MLTCPEGHYIIDDMTATQSTAHTSFTRVVSHKYFMELIKEARRVKYDVKGERNDFYMVRDDETGSKVFSGIKHSSGGWLANFSTLYWQEPVMLA